MADPYFIGILRLSPYKGDDPRLGGKPGMMLEEDFSFVDARGVIWTAHKGDITDGASIPQPLKWLVGSSFRTPYLGAAVLHDVYYRDQQRRRSDTDMMFYLAMVTNGVSTPRAWLMWLAVRIFGKDW